MPDRTELLKHFKRVTVEHPLPSLEDLLNLMKHDEEFRKKHMRYFFTDENGRQTGYSVPSNKELTWNFMGIQSKFVNVQYVCDELAKAYGIEIFCSSFYTPKFSRGLPCHFDSYELLLYQVSGKKSWKFWPQLPEDVYANKEQSQDDILRSWLDLHKNPEELILNEGESFYLEARRPHSVVALDQDSFSHSFGFNAKVK